MTLRTIEPEQHTAAKVAGFLYLFLMVTAMFAGFYARGRLIEPVNRNVALLAALWRLAECAIFALITLNDFVILRLLSGADYLRAFDTKQLQALAYTFA